MSTLGHQETAPINVRCIHFNERQILALIRIKNQLTFLVLRTTNMKRHKTQVRARSQCRLSLAAASQVVVRPWWSIVLIVLTVLEAAPAELTPGQAAADWVQEYGSRNKDCLEWSDTCVNCVRAQPGGNFNCSNVGIACQPKEVKCNRRVDEKTK